MWAIWHHVCSVCNCFNDWTLPLQNESSHSQYVNKWAWRRSSKTLNRQWVRFGLWIAVCQSLALMIDSHNPTFLKYKQWKLFLPFLFPHHWVPSLEAITIKRFCIPFQRQLIKSIFLSWCDYWMILKAAAKSLRKVRGEDIRAYVQKLVSKSKLSLL